MNRSTDMSWAQSAKKLDVVVEIAHRLGAEPPKMSTGSTEPKAIFDLVNERLGIGAPDGLRKPGLARSIVEASGEGWHPDYESRGDTVTKAGLLAVLGAVEFFLE